jgi:hypothetical protein
MDNFTVISCYTDDETYTPEAEALKSSMEELGLATEHVNIMPSQGSWERNCQYKPIFIKEKLLELDSPVVWVDADARILKYPDLFKDYPFDMGLFFPEKNKMWKLILSGTMYFTPHKEVFSLLDGWISLNKINLSWDQINLRMVTYGRSISRPCLNYSITVGELPLEYCSTEGVRADDPVIQHMQVSTELADKNIHISSYNT